MPTTRCVLIASTVLLFLLPCSAEAGSPTTLQVGPNLPFTRIEQALAAAHAGDTIEVHPLADNAPYQKVALLVRTPSLHIIAVPDKAKPELIPLIGTGFDYSGAGSVPRAIVQFDPGSDGSILEGFDLSGAHNGSHNGAAVRINQANHITVRSCVIHDNDMGIMSAGNGKPTTAVDQRIEGCTIFSNGAVKDPGYSHNLYLGGTSVVISGCEVRSSTAGHNIKSRAHTTRIEYCWVHDSANRELDLVDGAGDTDAPGSDAVVLGTVIAKSVGDMKGNRAVINFGQDGGHDHTGTLSLVHCTISTPYVAGVVTLSAPSARVLIANTLITDGGAKVTGQTIVADIAGKPSTPLAERCRFVASAATSGFGQSGSSFALITAPLHFADPTNGDYRLKDLTPGALPKAASLDELHLPADGAKNTMLLRFVAPHTTAERTDAAAPLVGAAPAWTK